MKCGKPPMEPKLLTFIQELRSSKAAEKLRAMVNTMATVLPRDDSSGAGEHSVSIEEPRAHVVPGDVIHLSAGDMIPADARLLTAKDLFVNQAALTGELAEKLSTPSRTARLPFIKSQPASLPLLVTTLSICILGLWLPSSPFAGALGLVPLPPGYWLALAAILPGYLLLAQFAKLWATGRFGLS